MALNHLIYNADNGHLKRKASDGHLINNETSTLAITTSSLPEATPGMAYNATMAASGGTTPYAWSIASGALPTGLTLSSAGVISGTCAAATGTYNVTIKVTDHVSNTVSTPFELSVGSLEDLSFKLTFNMPDSGTNVWIALVVLDPANFAYAAPSDYVPDSTYGGELSPVWSEYVSWNEGGSPVSPNGGTMAAPGDYGTPIAQLVSWASGASPSGTYRFYLEGVIGLGGGTAETPYTLEILSGSTVIWSTSGYMSLSPQYSRLWTFNSATGAVS